MLEAGVHLNGVTMLEWQDNKAFLGSGSDWEPNDEAPFFEDWRMPNVEAPFFQERAREIYVVGEMPIDSSPHA